MIERALNVLGWMSEPELWWLAVQASSRKKILELGSFYGKSTRALGDNTLGTVYSVDNFEGPPEVEMFEFERKSIKKIFDKNLSDLIQSGKVISIVQDHESYDPPIDDFEMIFIDGDHHYEAIMRDITRWLNKTKRPFLLGGHDYDHLGVKKAVDELFTNVNQFGGIWSVWIS
jgi:hypothetical protein